MREVSTPGRRCHSGAARDCTVGCGNTGRGDDGNTFTRRVEMTQGWVGIILALYWFDYQVLALLIYTKESVCGNRDSAGRRWHLTGKMWLIRSHCPAPPRSRRRF